MHIHVFILVHACIAKLFIIKPNHQVHQLNTVKNRVLHYTPGALHHTGYEKASKKRFNNQYGEAPYF